MTQNITRKRIMFGVSAPGERGIIMTVVVMIAMITLPCSGCHGDNNDKYCLYDGLNKIENVFDNARNIVIITVK